MESDDVRIGEDECHHVKLRGRAPEARTMPHRRGERLARTDLPGPLVHLSHEFKAVASVLEVLRLVVETPIDDSLVVLECPEDILKVSLEFRPSVLVVEDVLVRALAPVSAAMYERLRLRLLSELLGASAVGAEGEGHPHAMSSGDIQHLVDPLLESFLVLEPEHLMEIDADHVETEFLTESHLPVEDFRIESVLLPHLELIDRIRRNVAAAHRPLRLRPPGTGLLRSPLGVDRLLRRECKAAKHGSRQ